MAYLDETALRDMGFAHVGRNVKISDKASIYGAEEMSIGDHSRIDDFCVVSGKIEMGRNVLHRSAQLDCWGRSWDQSSKTSLL